MTSRVGKISGRFYTLWFKTRSQVLDANGLWTGARLIVLFVALGGCATTSEYEASKEGAYGPGYSEIRASDGVYRLRFNGGRYDDMENTLPLWHKRAVELCGVNNYTASPNTLVNDSVLMMYPGARYPEEVAYPYVEGVVKCKDLQLARRVGSAKYNPDEEFSRLALKAVSENRDAPDNELVDNFSHYIYDHLIRYRSDAVLPGKYEMTVVIDRFIVNAWQPNVVPGAVSGGIYLMKSTVTILDTGTGLSLGEKKITTSVSERGVAESRLKNEHAIDIVEYAVSLFPRADHSK